MTENPDTLNEMFTTADGRIVGGSVYEVKAIKLH